MIIFQDGRNLAKGKNRGDICPSAMCVCVEGGGGAAELLARGGGGGGNKVII